MATKSFLGRVILIQVSVSCLNIGHVLFISLPYRRSTNAACPVLSPTKTLSHEDYHSVQCTSGCGLSVVSCQLGRPQTAHRRRNKAEPVPVVLLEPGWRAGPGPGPVFTLLHAEVWSPGHRQSQPPLTCGGGDGSSGLRWDTFSHRVTVEENPLILNLLLST